MACLLASLGGAWFLCIFFGRTFPGYTVSYLHTQAITLYDSFTRFMLVRCPVRSVEYLDSIKIVHILCSSRRTTAALINTL